MADKIDPSHHAVLAAHLFVGGSEVARSFIPHSMGEPFAERALFARPPFDYVALGHIHRYQDLNHGLAPSVVYSGSIIRTDFSEEKDKKGVVIVEIGENVRHKFIELKRVRSFVTLECDLTGEVDVEGAIRNSAMGRNIKDAVVRVIYRIESDKPPIKNSIFNNILEGAYIISPVRRTIDSVRKNDRRENESITEHNPLDSLALYIDIDQSYTDRKKELLETASELLNTTNKME
jgi:exonuclease SbcD